MAAVSFTGRPDGEVCLPLSPRRRNYRAMSATSEASYAGHRYRRLPVLFERSNGSLWDPKFDSEVLEGQYRRSSFPQLRRCFRFALIYLTIASLTWAIYFCIFPTSSNESSLMWIGFVVVCVFLLLYFVAMFVFTHNEQYVLYHTHISLCTVTLLFATTLSVFLTMDTGETNLPPVLSQVGLFSICVSVLLLLYTAIPLPLYVCALLGTGYSLVFEILAGIFVEHFWVVTLKLLLHAAVHLIGTHILIMTQVRMRSTFLQVGQSVLVRRDLEIEKRIKEKMIHSVMPPKVAEWLLTSGPADDEEVEDADGNVRKLSSPRASQSPEMSIFRPFNMNCIEDVSILFADIAGFTKMSSNKSAEKLVGLLNDLFGRFDHLCVRHGCEKISTLGDCYYCVSGCPEPRSDHAKCCVEMGLSMIKAVKRFDEDTGEDVNMRIGVHTGTVLCGVVGTKRFKFDVWSNDVTFANKMESTGRPGRVHISSVTYEFLNDEYYVEDGEPCNGKKTYFIIGSKNEVDGIAACESTWYPNNSAITTRSNIQTDEQSREMGITITGTEEQETLSPMIDSEMNKNKTNLTQSWSTLNSRKDSGIRSRRSSIQAQLMETNSLAPADFLMDSAPNEYYTSSQLSVDEEVGHKIPTSPSNLLDPNCPLNESLTRFHLLRKQSDLQMIKCIQHDATHVNYFMKPPISHVTLFFNDPEIEEEYRERAHLQQGSENTPTLGSSMFNTYFDILVAALIYVIVAFTCFVVYFQPVSTVWLVFFCIATCWQLGIVLVCIQQLLSSRTSSGCLRRFYDACTRWYLWHVCGAFLISLPVISVYTNFTCVVASNPLQSRYFCYLVFVALMHFCNFTQLNCWMKSSLASVGGCVMIVLLCSDVCPINVLSKIAVVGRNVTESVGISNATVFENATLVHGNATVHSDSMVYGNASVHSNISSSASVHTVGIFSSLNLLRHEAIVAVLLLLVLVWYLNREFEISYRVSFHGKLLAERDQKKIQALKDQADWLLHNIIPKHVAEHLKNTAKYSENHVNVGIIFASITNFNDMYDESYHAGKEYLRVLNELIGDYDELLHRPEFRSIEKIKTIGTTFMAASGLNPKSRDTYAHPHQHLFELMDFAIALQKVIETFNDDLLEFGFEIRIGYNFGDVTAGVIGTTKLYYDIWGDAVNIASRMDSTGVVGRIQVPEQCLSVLEEVFEFEPRGSIYVKGKDNMNVYLLVKKRQGVEYRTPRRSDGAVSHHSVQFIH